MHRARRIASGLLLFTGVAHLALYFAAAGSYEPPLAIFGVIYFALGLALLRPGAWPLWLAALLPALGGLGGSAQLRERFDAFMALFVAIDVVVVACCAWLLIARPRA